jgi:hypothetical protein
MVLKRFKYENGLDIIAPLKCGTRWLENETNPISIEEMWSHHHLRINDLTKKTYWIYRNPEEHLISALKTEIRVAIEFGNSDIDTIINSFLNATATHWSPILFQYMYNHWNRIEFNVIELTHLSNLFPGIPYDSNNYKMNNYHKTTYDTSEMLKMISKEDLNILYAMIEIDKPYLTKILNKELIEIKLL